jgi:hypothetical protein
MKPNNDLNKSIQNHARCIDRAIYSARLIMLESTLKTEKAMDHVFPPGPNEKVAAEKLQTTLTSQIKDCKQKLETLNQLCTEPNR